MKTTSHPLFIASLRDKLILRRSCRADAEALASFNAKMHSDDGPEEPDDQIAALTLDLMGGKHPTFGEHDFTVVEDPTSGEIVSCSALIPQQWSYEGIPFGVGRLELIATDPRYRCKGLVREQINILHEWSRDRGFLVQMIVGIPNFYRQFGYEMALPYAGGRGAYAPQIPSLDEGEAEAFTFRCATRDDLPLLEKGYRQMTGRSMVNVERTPEIWRYEMEDIRERNVERMQFMMVENRDRKAVGFLAHRTAIDNGVLRLILFEMFPGEGYQGLRGPVLRYLWKTGQEMAKAEGGTCSGVFASLPLDHPFFSIAAEWMPRSRQPYALYIRVPDLSAFLRTLIPALEKRLAGSMMSGYSGDLVISRYRDASRLVFKDGRIEKIEGLALSENSEGDARFPGDTFLQVLFGFRSMDEVKYMWPDCGWNPETKALVEILFPKKPSYLWLVN